VRFYYKKYFKIWTRVIRKAKHIHYNRYQSLIIM
jgi:hypothetical protein